MKSTASQLISFMVTGTIEFTNPCFVNTISGLSSLSFTLSDKITFLPASVSDSVSELYGVEGLCGQFTQSSVICAALGASKSYLDSNDKVVLELDWKKNNIGTITCSIMYESTLGSQFISSQAVLWQGDDFDIEITDPCTSSSYMPLDFSATQSFEIDYTICQSTDSELSFDFSDALSTLTNQPDFCGTPLFNFHFAVPAL